MQKQLPDLEATLSAVHPLSNLVYVALERATVKARSFFNQEKRRHDPFLAPCLIRFFAKHTLRDVGINAEEDGDVSDFEGLPNNGLSFHYKQHHVRILKAATVRGESWKLPGCGTSDPKTDFYNQQLSFYFDTKNSARSSILNIIYLWDFDAQFNLAGIYLGCPAAAGVYAKDVLTQWCEPIPHPALSRPAEKATAPTPSSDDGLDQLLRTADEDQVDAIKNA